MLLTMYTCWHVQHLLHGNPGIWIKRPATCYMPMHTTQKCTWLNALLHVAQSRIWAHFNHFIFYEIGPGRVTSVTLVHKHDRHFSQFMCTKTNMICGEHLDLISNIEDRHRQRIMMHNTTSQYSDMTQPTALKSLHLMHFSYMLKAIFGFFLILSPFFK